MGYKEWGWNDTPSHELNKVFYLAKTEYQHKKSQIATDNNSTNIILLAPLLHLDVLTKHLNTLRETGMLLKLKPVKRDSPLEVETRGTEGRYGINSRTVIFCFNQIPRWYLKLFFPLIPWRLAIIMLLKASGKTPEHASWTFKYSTSQILSWCGSSSVSFWYLFCP